MKKEIFKWDRLALSTYYIIRTTQMEKLTQHTIKEHGKKHILTVTDTGVLQEIATKRGWELFSGHLVYNMDIQFFTRSEAMARLKYYNLRAHKNETFELCKGC
jgi:hypothetical protein